MVDQTACRALDNFARDTTHEASLSGQIFDGYIVARVTICRDPLNTADMSASADNA